MTWRQPLVALLVLGSLVYLGMAFRTALALRQVGVPAPRAWTASLLAWPLVRRAVREPRRLPASPDPDRPGGGGDHTGSP